MHGKYLTTIDDESIDTLASQACLKTGSLFVETEGFIAAIQDQVVPTRAYRKRIIKENIRDAKCRMCSQKEETVEHLISGCSVLAPKQYLDRHNRVAKIIHQTLGLKYGLIDNEKPYYEYDPELVLESENSRLYWNRSIITDRHIPNNIPDIVLTLKEEKSTYMIDVAIPLGPNINKTYSEKISKYLPLADEIKIMWRMNKVKIIPVILGATGEIPVTLHKSLRDLQLSAGLISLMQKSVLLDTCAIVRRVLGDGNRGTENLKT